MGDRSLGVIIAAYNAAATIDQTLASVAAQTRRPDQIIVADDASTDDTVARAMRWKELLPIEIVTLEENSGAGIARAQGVAGLDTDLVALIDADDLWLPDHLALLSATHAEHGGLIAPSCHRWLPGVALKEYRTNLPAPDRQLEAFLFRNLIMSSTLFERSVYDEVGGFRAYRRSQDWDLWVRMLAAGTRITLARPTTMIYRIRPTRWPLDQILSTHIDILERFIDEHEGPMTDVAQRSIVSHRARWALHQSFTATALGNVRDARRLARHAMRGDLRLKARAVMMMLAPRVGLRMKRQRGTGTLQIDTFDATAVNSGSPTQRSAGAAERGGRDRI
ncbi:MAG: glycosyltransferase family A protein [Actinomycetota bacterium]